MAEGIADLSYRHYSGELGDPKKRWRVIAAQGFKDAISKSERFGLSPCSPAGTTWR